MEICVKSHIPIEAEKESKIIVASLIPVRTDICLRELERSAGCVKPIDMAFLHFGDYRSFLINFRQIKTRQISLETSILLRQSRGLGKFPVGILDIHRIRYHIAEKDILMNSLGAESGNKPLGDNGKTLGVDFLCYSFGLRLEERISSQFQDFIPLFKFYILRSLFIKNALIAIAVVGILAGVHSEHDRSRSEIRNQYRAITAIY